MSPLTVGSKAFDFCLTNQQQQQVQLSELLTKQRVLVYFYPKAMTPGCTVQAKALRDHLQDLQQFNVAPVGISPDSAERLAKFAKRDELNFTLLSDENHAVAEAYGVWGEKKFMGKVYDGIHRISFLISQDGTIEQVFNKFKTKEHHQVILDYLAS
ncbi:thioredoxin-dependent thiol peroxidase [Rheinheimera sp. MMS21-TC3]|uniref:thioredoxin-dependent thiol peroxidase n=1 Tax=Rheinheimera sp. MMS21-TC3 TaxID=3072790 RepID=UPI0028C407F3|nr:thioredoxin-dependent thiol peroxidase [Rheinheimera sp. MMS21-TC3]WNO60801.1 thioredoxin-dependent thiol peroxidase [Rheinheimera sp. MMS21-TC3]